MSTFHSAPRSGARTSMTVRRRTLLGLGLATATTAVVGCSGTSPAGGGASTAPRGGSVLPTQLVDSAITPDLAGTVTGVPDGFLRYPDNPTVSTERPTGIGTVTALVSSYAPAPKPASANAYLRDLNERVDGDLQLQVISAGEYPAKLATTISGGEFPDLVEMPQNQPTMPQMLAAMAADLTDLLAGDGVTAYPNLAAFTEEMWRMTIFDNRIYGIPATRPVQGSLSYVRDDLVSELGLSTDPASFEEFVDLCAALTDKSESRFALSGPPMVQLSGAAGCPNTWRWDGDDLVHLYETEEYRQAVSWCAELQKAGHIHPHGFEASATTQGKLALIAGTVGIHQDGFSAWGSLARMLPAEEQQVLGGLSVRGFGGATPTYVVNAGATNFTVIKKTDPERVKQLLELLNYLAAPFGSEEFLQRKYGTEGVHHTMTDGNPILTDQGADEITPVTEAWDYHLIDGPKVAYEGSLTEITRRKHEFAAAAEQFYASDPLLGLYSETQATKGATFSRTVTDLQTGIIVGRNSFADLDKAVQEWNSGDGATIKAEFAAARDQQQ